MIEPRAKEQIRADTRGVVGLAQDIGRFDVSVFPLLKQRRNQARCEARYRAYQPHCDGLNHKCTGRRWLVRRDGIGAIWEINKFPQDLPKKSYSMIARIWGQLFIKFDDKSSNNCREKPDLEACYRNEDRQG